MTDKTIELMSEFDTWCLCGKPECQKSENFKEATKAIEALITEAEDKAMGKFGLKRGVKYDIKASEKVIVITPKLIGGSDE